MNYLNTLQDSVQELLNTYNVNLNSRTALVGGGLVVAGSALLAYQILNSPDDGLVGDDEKIPSVEAIVRLKAGGDFSTMAVRRVRDTSDSLGPSDVRIKVKGVRCNPADEALMKGFPGITYKVPCIGGCDGAGTIIKVGSAVDTNKFKIGDNVLFYKRFDDIGTWAQEINMDVKCLSKIPTNVNLEYASNMALNIQTAFECLNAMNGKQNETVLILGAGGGVGFLGVTIAVSRGLKVFAVGSQRDEEYLKKAGVTRFINYKTEDFVQIVNQENIKIDYVFDTVGEESLLKAIELKPKNVVTITVPDIQVLKDRLGVDMSWIIRKLLGMMTAKFFNAAAAANVLLIAYCTGGNNGRSLQMACDEISKLGNKFIQKPPKNIRTLQDIKQKGMSKNDVGTVIMFS